MPTDSVRGKHPILMFSSVQFPGGSDDKSSAYNAGDPRSANQNHSEVPFHASQNACYQKVYKQYAGEVVEKREPSYTVGGNAN